MERLFKYFDKNCDGNVDYNEFLRGVRGNFAILTSIQNRRTKRAQKITSRPSIQKVRSHWRWKSHAR